MKINRAYLSVVLLLAASSVIAQQGVTKPQTESRPTGFRFFNQHLTIKPYVSLSYTYDSNIDADSTDTDDSVFAIHPAVDFQWQGAKWMLVGNVWYRHRYFCEYNEQMGENSYGESLQFRYASSAQNAKGWSLMLSERYAFINQSDDLDSRGGRGIWRDRQTVDVAGIVERRFTERWHMDIQGQYSWLDYDNQTGRYIPLYGWNQYSAGAQLGYAASKWTDLLVAAGYSRYEQDIPNDRAYRNYSGQSDSYSIQAGLGTRATERISYRALMGTSWFDYDGYSDCGWTYTLSANWRVHRQVQLSLLGSSYYQPSDEYLGQALKVYNLSAGISYLTLGDRLKLTGNIAWRFDETCYSADVWSSRDNYDRTHFSARLAADYLLNRWTSIFAHLIWDNQTTDTNKYYEYDRIRGVLGVRFHY
jgi:hypothetical protein